MKVPTQSQTTQDLLSVFAVCGVSVLPLISMVLVALAPLHIAQAQDSGEPVTRAYQLRMQGHTPEAKAVLDDVLERDTSNANAHFEMARLLTATDPFNSGEILSHFNKAVLHDPDNPYFIFGRARAEMLAAYIAMHQDNQENAQSLTRETCKDFRRVLELDPRCGEAYLYLVDINASLPEEAGGNQETARAMLDEMPHVDDLYRARASLILAEDGEKESTFWQSYLARHGESAQPLELLFKAYLMEDDIASAESVYNTLVNVDPAHDILVLDLARAHIMRVMQGKGDEEVDPDKAKAYLLQYVESDRPHPACVRAWSYGQLAGIEMFQHNRDGAEKYRGMATSLCPGFSKAFAVPGTDDPLDSLTYKYVSFFRPF